MLMDLFLSELYRAEHPEEFEDYYLEDGTLIKQSDDYPFVEEPTLFSETAKEMAQWVIDLKNQDEE